MDEDKLPSDVVDAIIDRLEPWELVDFLTISETKFREMVEFFEEDILENIEDVLDFIGVKEYNTLNDNDYG